MKITKKRASLLRELERIIGSETFNGKIKNYGSKGTFLGEGRDFRYPLSFTDETGQKIKPKPPYSDLPIDVQMTGRYVMGTNELHIMRALEKAVQYLEENHALKI
ncbi:hypothetical protein I3J27_38425 [Bradyrhizobium xenonodulans]|uniref:Uncharacterized protein n=1 Tax=Bradyrhizobium xenonodulans TaxID=2736875 RepID=A0ABY7MMY2_9BRAD|nr:hypothetical protein [Bradyrhizobium xenonodulans]WBL78747.1 hypothetical protein I3J27_38425 [Bradyrhizobium xenonodulans]